MNYGKLLVMFIPCFLVVIGVHTNDPNAWNPSLVVVDNSLIQFHWTYTIIMCVWFVFWIGAEWKSLGKTESNVLMKQSSTNSLSVTEV